MAYATHLQQVLAYLKQGNKVQPQANVTAGIATVPQIATNPDLELASQASKLASIVPQSKMVR